MVLCIENSKKPPFGHSFYIKKINNFTTVYQKTLIRQVVYNKHKHNLKSFETRAQCISTFVNLYSVLILRLPTTADIRKTTTIRRLLVDGSDHDAR